MNYDVAVIGAGINGCCIAHRLHLANQKVVVFDQGGVAHGGSGAAGAFLSPKFSKGGELKELINSALDIALDFYSTNFPQYIQHHDLLHIAKDEKDALNLKYFKTHEDIPLLQDPYIEPNNEYIYTSKSAIVDAQAMCKALLESIEFKEEEIVTLEKQDDVWLLNNKYKAKRVILATGAYKHELVRHPYAMIRGIWGHRIDIETTTNNPISIHQFVSTSPSQNQKLSIGATHNVHYHPQNTDAIYDFEAGREELLEKASRTLKLQDVKVIKDYVGLRSGSFDYLPQVGALVDVESSLEKLTTKQKTQKKPDYSLLEYKNNLYMINGSAGYGYVLAPYLSQLLAQHLIKAEEIPASLNPARFFYRWAKSTTN